MGFRFAGVHVLGNPFHVDGIYDYCIPPEMEESFRPGCFVTVPFGIGNQIRLGLVTEIKNSSKYSEGAKLVKMLLPEILWLDEEQQELCQFLKWRTVSPVGDIVRAMIPASALSRLQELYALVPGSVTDPDAFSVSDRFVYDYLSAHGETPLRTLREKGDILVERSVRRMRAKGMLTRRTVFREVVEGSAEKLWAVAVPDDIARELLTGRKCEEKKLTSPQQKKVLSALLEEDGAMLTADLLEQSGVTEAVLRTMEKNGILESREHRVNRNPYEEAPFVGMVPQTLNEEQEAAYRTLAALADADEPKAALLQGVTGSGKTRVMTALIDHLLGSGKGVIVLLPEIALTPQSVAVFCSRYGDRVAVMHSALSAGERYDAYCRIRRGDARVVIGTRSAVFAPVENLGAIIIDEEQEHTYKSDRNPRYHARDVARYRCKYHNALMLLASATPSLESAHKAREGVYADVRLTRRYGGNALPEVEIADMREEAREGNTSLLGKALTARLGVTLSRGEQAILFLNRRGYNRTVSCRSCGQPITCPNCSVAMTYHTRPGTFREGDLLCHWCGKKLPLPKVCPACGSEHLAHVGYGTQRVEEELQTLFPAARILRMDTDTTSTKNAYDRMLGAFRRHEADILLGTQMVTKGHDFPDVTLVGVLLADTSLYVDDYRASERTFAMLTQVIGRAGRRDRPGYAVIQTNNPDHEVIRLACSQDFDSFYQREIRLRKLLCFPPYCDLVLLTVNGYGERDVALASARMVQEINEMRAGPFPDVELLLFGPFEAPVYRVENRYRMRVVLKCRLTRRTYEFLAELTTRLGIGFTKRLSVNVDLNPAGL